MNDGFICYIVTCHWSESFLTKHQRDVTMDTAMVAD